jgi:hypothetical protein
MRVDRCSEVLACPFDVAGSGGEKAEVMFPYGRPTECS